MTRLQLAFIAGVLAGWGVSLMWRWAEYQWAAERAARDSRAWDAAESKPRLLQSAQQIARDHRSKTGGKPAA